MLRKCDSFKIAAKPVNRLVKKGVKINCSNTESGQCLEVGHTATEKPVISTHVTDWVEEPVSPVSQSSIGGATNNPPFPKMP